MGKDLNPNPSLSRRDFITGMAVTVAAAGAGVAALSPLINAEEIPSVDDFLQQHYERLTTDQKKSDLCAIGKRDQFDIWRQGERFRSATAKWGGVWLCS